ncbi:MAG: glycerol kinase [Alphaproteobacteria bacterium]|nr:MAG: glycerol kinase [Alphaproteobacteria bacterium]
MTTHLLAIDQGTSSSRAIIFDEHGDIRFISQQPVDLIYPQDGWVEQDPKALVEQTFSVIRDVLSQDANVTASLAGVGITNQRETTIVWDRKMGEPVYNAIVWQDRRTAEFCTTLKGNGDEKMVREKTGLLLDPYFSATKLRWILESVDGVRERAENGELLFGTVDCYLLWHLTGGRVHATDATNASRTMLYNIIDHQWDDDLLELFNIPNKMLPKVLDNISEFGQFNSDLFGCDLMVGGMAGDQQSALIGQGCVRSGMVKSTYGTGCFALMNIGDAPTLSEHKLITTIGASVDGKVSYALEGSIFNAGTAIQFLRDNLSFIGDAKESENMARSVPDNGGVYFVPAFTGLGAPYWDPAARGVICGLSRDTQKAHIVRAALEAQAYQTRDLIDVMQKDSGQKIDVLRADGGLVANGFMCQFLADTLGIDIEIPKVAECTAWGAACLAGVQAGVFVSIDDVAARWKVDRHYKPREKKRDMDVLYSGWQRAVEKSC